MRRAFVGIVALLGVSAGLAIAGAQSADAPDVLTTRFENEWPNSVVASALVTDGDAVESATFLYTILPEGAVTRKAAEVSQGEVTRVEAEFPTRNASLWIPAGADFEWRWELVLESGERVETEPQVWRYEDPRFSWQSLREGDLEVAWYDNRSIAEAMLEEGLQALREVSPFLGLDELIPIKVYVWANNTDAREVERIDSETFEESVITGGTRVLADLVHIYQPTRWVMRHELTHVLTKLAGEGAYGSLPAWLDEGMATIAEGDWRTRRGAALNYAIETDIVLSLRSMEAPARQPGYVDIFYGQSASVVTYLLETYGNGAMNELFDTFKEGSTVEAALQEVYGLSRDELDNEWRGSVGLPPREVSEDRSRVIENEVIGGAQVAEDDGSTRSQDASTPRTEEEIAERTAEIERRQEERRAGPLWELSGPFPWEWVMIGLASVLVLASGVLLTRVLGSRLQ